MLVDAKIKIGDIGAHTLADRCKITAERDKDRNAARREKHGGDSRGRSDAASREHQGEDESEKNANERDECRRPAEKVRAAGVGDHSRAECEIPFADEGEVSGRRNREYRADV